MGKGLHLGGDLNDIGAGRRHGVKKGEALVEDSASTKAVGQKRGAYIDMREVGASSDRFHKMNLISMHWVSGECA